MKKIWVTSGGIAILALAVYFLLGGFSPIQVELVQSEGYQIQGRLFEGKYNSTDLEELFFQMKKYSEITERPFTVINFDEFMNEETGDVKQFVGVLGSLQVDTLETQIIAAGQLGRATITAHNFVMPKPSHVRKKLQEISSKPLENYSIEIYTEEKLVIEIPVQVN
jgi:hypothetical protein